MAGPLAGISAAQVAQQKLPEAAQQANKAGPSKFDQSMKSGQTQGVDKAGQVGQVNHAQQVQKLEQAKQIDQVAKTNKADLNKLDKNVTGKGMDPVSQKAEVNKSSSMVMSMMSNLEKGGANIDKLINGSLSSKSMSNQELLQMQAGMYKYTQELDLCSKVVEKATSGLKDTLKTQV